MERIISQSHDRNTLLFASSRLFERAAYYGLRSLIVLYILSESIVSSQTDALSLYGWFVSSTLIARIVGAAIGDLVIGNKWAIIVGVLLQAMGALSFCVGNLYGVYIGLALVAIGAGLYNPNIEARYGKWHLSKKKLLDAAFVILYLAANLGALLGTVCIAMLGELYSWRIAFIASAICFIISFLLFNLIKKKTQYDILEPHRNYKKYLIPVMGVLVAITIFWAMTEISHIKHAAFHFVDDVGWQIPSSLMQSMSGVFFLPLSVIAIIVWSKFYSSSILKIRVGFIFGILSFVLLYLIPTEFTTASAGIYVIAMLLLSISELYISPVLKSYLVRVSNPKYLAIILSVAIGPASLLANGLLLGGDFFFDNSQIGILISIGVTLILLTFIFLGPYKKDKMIHKEETPMK